MILEVVEEENKTDGYFLQDFGAGTSHTHSNKSAFNAVRARWW